MKKYKNVKAIKAHKCSGYLTVLDKDGFCEVNVLAFVNRSQIQRVTATNANVPNTSTTEKRVD